jgi:hypothetical protein
LVAVTLNHANDAGPYLAQGASLILIPFVDAARRAVKRLSDLAEMPVVQ